MSEQSFLGIVNLNCSVSLAVSNTKQPTTSLIDLSDFHSADSALLQKGCSVDHIHLQAHQQARSVRASAGQIRFDSGHSLWFVE